MRSTIRPVITGLVATALVLAARGGEEKSDLERFRGKWKVVSVLYEGKSLKMVGYTQEIVGDKVLFGGGFYGKITLNPKDMPKSFDIDHYDAGGNLRGREQYKAIYEFDGDDKMKWCVTQKNTTPRPRTFDSKPGDDAKVIVLERAKDDGKNVKIKKK